MRTRTGLVLLLCFICIVASSSKTLAADLPAVHYGLPVDAAISKMFSAPANPYAPGNRGTEFAVSNGQSVRASAAGIVSFAGNIGANKFASIQHGDGIRTTYSYLQNIVVRQGDSVRTGQLIARTSSQFQWGARIGEHAYVDPLTLLDDPPSEVHLVKDDLVLPAMAPLAAIEPSDFALAWLRERDSMNCTEDVTTANTLSLSDRHIAILVAGLGTQTGQGSIFRLPFTKLGYAPRDTLQFSYNGGNAIANPYQPADTTQDLDIVGQRFADYVAQVHAQNPGVPIDIFAHSLGGLVVHAGINDLAGQNNLGIENVVTISSPHQGADLASAASMLRDAEENTVATSFARKISGFDINTPALQELDPASPFIRQLQNSSIPEGIHVLSIGTRLDPIVSNTRTWWNGANNVVVDARPLPGETDHNPHSYVVSDPSVESAIRLQLAGMPPSCESARAAIVDALAGRGIAAGEKTLGGALALLFR